MAGVKVMGSTMKGLEMLQDLQVSRDLQLPQRYPAKSTVTTQQLCRVSSWQPQEAGTAELTFVTQ